MVRHWGSVLWWFSVSLSSEPRAKETHSWVWEKSSHICENASANTKPVNIVRNNRVWELRLTSYNRNLKWRFIPTERRKIAENKSKTSQRGRETAKINDGAWVEMWCWHIIRFRWKRKRDRWHISPEMKIFPHTMFAEHAKRMKMIK